MAECCPCGGGANGCSGKLVKGRAAHSKSALGRPIYWAYVCNWARSGTATFGPGADCPLSAMDLWKLDVGQRGLAPIQAFPKQTLAWALKAAIFRV